MDLVTADGRLVTASLTTSIVPLRSCREAGVPGPVLAVRGVSSGPAVEVRHWGGAMARPSDDAGPVGHRGIPFSVTIDGPVEAAAPLAAYATGGSFLNFLHDPSKTHTAYPAQDYLRLRELKRAYDPDNVLHRNHNIPPSPTAREEQAPHPRSKRQRVWLYSPLPKPNAVEGATSYTRARPPSP